jgi:hypothetical protein
MMDMTMTTVTTFFMSMIFWEVKRQDTSMIHEIVFGINADETLGTDT